VGNAFASPNAEQMLEVTRAIDGGQGVLYIYGNYGGDVMNFDKAAEMAELEGIEVRTVLVAEDVASAPPEMGIHGEPGVRCGKLEVADDIADRLLTAILADLEIASGRAWPSW